MNKLLLLSLAILGVVQSCAASAVGIAIHGGAGTIVREEMTPQIEAKYRHKLRQALAAGHGLLVKGGSSIDAVQAAIVVMEDSPLFNAGRGAVFAHDRTNQMDASIMRGDDLNAGAVAGVSGVRNPIGLARQVMENSVHVMLSGSGAEQFALQRGVKFEEPDYFRTERRWRQINKALDQSALAPAHKFGTVGAVALDRHGNLAAGTSTGGMTNKRFGRIGDSPIIGAGTYADNAACAISATGHGEFFIRAAVAHDICARKRYLGLSLQQAADQVIQEKLVNMQGSGGVVAMDPAGEVVFSFNTPGMYRGSMDDQGEIYVGIFGAVPQ